MVTTGYTYLNRLAAKALQTLAGRAITHANQGKECLVGR